MFAELIRKRFSGPAFSTSDAAFESTTVSLSSAVPRPIERRIDDRRTGGLRVGKLTGADGSEQLIKIKNLSAGGVMAIIKRSPAIGEQVHIELSSQRIPATVLWTRENAAGFKFDGDVDLGELLAGRKPRHGFRPRPPRLEIPCKASVRIDKTYYTVDVRDISLGGIKVEPISEYCVGKKVLVVVESLRPIKGEVRWYNERRAGIVFDGALEFAELSEWIGKRLELASLKASYKPQS